MSDLELITIDTGDLRFTARAAGPVDGSVVLLLHGFPDRAATFDGQLAALAAAGFRAIAPTMRGYEPSSQPADGDHSLVTLADDVVAWMDELDVERAHVVGHDWGAATTYLAITRHPERFERAVTLAVPPTPRIPDAVRKVPKQILLSWYMTFFQLRVVADRIAAAKEHALIRWLWSSWSPTLDAPDDLRDVFAQPGVLRSALAYYRQNATPPLLLGLRQNEATVIASTSVPTLVIHGEDDRCLDRRLFDHAVVEADFSGGVRREMLPGAAHFLHLEQPDTVNELILDWLNGGSSAGGE